MQIVWLIIIGAAAGFIATRMMKMETNIVTTIAIGIGGALIGGLVLRALLTVLGAAAGFIGAILGALVLIWLWQTYIDKGRD
ncbi:GlsB/YeaQ/YmgE family stress response membrane protein [Marimonas arenosa]|uniref:GlsB/YeaQ/YmgE family stress response membrane protein n=1 Tax=Marimonas arenosa TaxID=1795305 RepID=A0AAE3WE62_9RHOB|nr:GlsB/YeaQ/YmgE family stress response membrane protein [Marimonas arenosa]MDQ2090750.1 GlsB/YeaQ/YmgE family stress response membrane protein [Marimonas arenosa]